MVVSVLLLFMRLNLLTALKTCAVTLRSLDKVLKLWQVIRSSIMLLVSVVTRLRDFRAPDFDSEEHSSSMVSASDCMRCDGVLIQPHWSSSPQLIHRKLQSSEAP